MFASKFHYNVDNNKGIVAVSPTFGTVLKWCLPTIIMTAAAIGLPWLLESFDTPISVTDELVRIQNEEK